MTAPPARRRRGALAGLALALAAAPAGAETLVSALSSDRVSITSNFTGSQVVIFGTIERDGQSASRNSRYDIVVTLAGEPRTLVARRKDRVLGIWVNHESERMLSVPSFLAIASSAPLADIATPALRAREGLGFDMLPVNRKAESIPPIRTEFQGSFIRLMRQSGLYGINETGVEFLSAQLFRAPIAIPANIPVGWYEATVYLFAGGVLLSKTSESFAVQKSGFEQLVTDTAHHRPMLYGLVTVAIACLTGWLAGILFRKD